MDDLLLAQIGELLERADNNAKITISECDRFLNQIPSFSDKHTIEDTRSFLEYLGNPDSNMKIMPIQSKHHILTKLANKFIRAQKRRHSHNPISQHSIEFNYTAAKYSLLSLGSGFIDFSPGFHPAGHTSSGFSCTNCNA